MPDQQGYEPVRLDSMERQDLPRGLRLAVARSRAERTLGLARMDAMPAGWGLRIPRCRSVHTFTMRFPLDLVWMDGDGAVVRVDHDVGPCRLRSCLKARDVVEVNAGEGDAFAAALSSPRD